VSDTEAADVHALESFQTSTVNVIALLGIGYLARQRRLVHFGWRRWRRSSLTQLINHLMKLAEIFILSLQLSLEGTVCLNCLLLLRIEFYLPADLGYGRQIPLVCPSSVSFAFTARTITVAFPGYTE